MSGNKNIFTIKIPGQVTDIRSGLRVSNPLNPEIYIDTMAVWDTGSLPCFISRKVMKELGLSFESELTGHGLFGSGTSPLGMVSIRIVSEGRFFDVKAGVVDDLHRGDLCQVLIGMNFIGKGQMSFSFCNGMSTFSFSIPAVDDGDLVDRAISADEHIVFDYLDIPGVPKDVVD